MGEQQTISPNQNDQDFNAAPIAPQVQSVDYLDDNERLEREKNCEQIAMQHIVDIKKWGSGLPTRFAFSGLSAKTFAEGFVRSSFVVDRSVNGYQQGYLLADTKNEVFSQGVDYNLANYFSGREFVDFVPIPEGPIFDPEEHKEKSSSQVDIPIPAYFPSPAEKKKEFVEYILPFINPEKIRRFLKEGDVNASDELVEEIVKNILAMRPASEWTFEQQELMNDLAAQTIVKEKGDSTAQIYDIAYLADLEKAVDQHAGYLPGVEQEITAPPEVIFGVVQTNVGTVLKSNYYVEKMKRIYIKNPELSRPVYNSAGDVLWPVQMTNEEVQAMQQAKNEESI